MTGDLARPAPAGVTPTTSKQLLTVARNALAEAETLPDVARLADYGQVCRVAAQRAKLGKQSQDDWGEFVLDAERRAGQMLKAMPRNEGGRPPKTHDSVSRVSPPPLRDVLDSPNDAAARQKASRWEQLAELDDDEYEGLKTEIREDQNKVITRAAALAAAKHKIRETNKRADAAAQAAVAPSRALVSNEPWQTWLPRQPICDLLLTDPPYSTDIDDIDTFAALWLPLALAKVKATGRAYVCIGAYPRELRAYLNVTPPAGIELAQALAWTYRNTLGPKPTYDYKLNWQAILYYRGVDAPPLDCPEMLEQFSVQDINAPDGRQGDRWHAWQKPDRLAEQFVRHATRPGAVVLDLFAGTGTFPLAAARLGREAYGCEPDPEMFATAIERGCIRAT